MSTGAEGQRKQKSILAGASVISLLTLLSRVIGLARDVLLAHLLGNAARDAFLIAWRIPNLFRKLFGEGALSAAFLPSYTQLLESDPARARRLARNSGAVVLLSTSIGVIVLELLVCLPLPWASLFPGDDPEKVELILELLRVLSPYALLICLVAFLSGMHNARGSFAAPSASPGILNVFWIAAMLGSSWYVGGHPFAVVENEGAVMLAWGILAAGIVQLVLIYSGERERLGVIPLWPSWRDSDLRDVMSRFLPMTFGLGIYQINLLMDGFIAEALIPGDGAVTALYLGDRLMQLPQALVGIAVATAAFPEFSRLAGRRALPELSTSIVNTLRFCVSLSLPASVGLAMVAHPLVDLFFSGEAIDQSLSDRTTAVIVIVSCAVLASSLLHVLVRGYYALGEARAPMRIGLVAVGVNLILNLSLVWTLEERGLAVATVVSTAVNAALLAWGLRKILPDISWRPFLAALPRVALATLGMGLAIWLFQELASPTGDTLWMRAGRVVIPVLVGIGAYAILAVLLGVPDIARHVRRGRSPA